MLKTNSKKASENLKAYILEHADGTNYGVNLENENISTNRFPVLFQSF